jgi:hypothetical protein
MRWTTWDNGPRRHVGDGQEACMASKDKGGRSTRKVAAKSQKEKRLDKKAKKDAVANKGKVV